MITLKHGLYIGIVTENITNDNILLLIPPTYFKAGRWIVTSYKGPIRMQYYKILRSEKIENYESEKIYNLNGAMLLVCDAAHMYKPEQILKLFKNGDTIQEATGNTWYDMLCAITEKPPYYGEFQYGCVFRIPYVLPGVYFRFGINKNQKIVAFEILM